MTNEQQEMIEDCERRSEKLSDWECDFIDSISRRDSLTEKQVDTLEAIWERVT